MAGWHKHTGQAVALPLDNVDTDQLIPARFMSVPRSEGYGRYLMYDLRRDGAGAMQSDFPLNQCQNASILVAGRNFGSGSSREAAVYALVDAGIRAVIAPSFGDIFSGNAVNNGLLPALVSGADAAALSSAIGGGALSLQIDLKTGKITFGERIIDFALDESWRTKLIKGWDDIDLTLHYRADIARFKENRIQTASWAWPARAD